SNKTCARLRCAFERDAARRRSSKCDWPSAVCWPEHHRLAAIEKPRRRAPPIDATDRVPTRSASAMHDLPRIAVPFSGSGKLALFDGFDLADATALVEVRRQRAVETQDREPALSGHGLDPVAAWNARRLRRPDPDRGAAVDGDFGGGRGEAPAAGA